jgi:hypothetical protein
MVEAVAIFTLMAIYVIVRAWKRKKIETIRHETARLLIEKNQAIDSAILTQLFNPPPPAIKPGSTYRIMKIIGTIVTAAGIGLWVMCIWFSYFTANKHLMAFGGPAALLSIIGVGIIIAAGFMPHPTAKDSETEVSKSFGNGSEQ